MENMDERFRKDLEYMLRLLKRVEYLENKAKDQLDEICSLQEENRMLKYEYSDSKRKRDKPLPYKRKYDGNRTYLWRPTDETPPKAGRYLCALFDKDGTFLAILEWNDTFGGRWQCGFEGEGSFSDIGNVIAWMPLPEPPKERA